MGWRLRVGLKALVELGAGQVGQYALYRLGLATGYYRWRTKDRPGWGAGDVPFGFRPILSFPEREALAAALGEEGAAQLLKEAQEVVEGRVRLFGGQPTTLQLTPPGPSSHWTRYAVEGIEDVKPIWEAGRFGWAFTLARAFVLTGEERYAQAFWENAEAFLTSNPPYRGPHWASGQEVALRLMAFAIALQAFAGAQHSTPERAGMLRRAMALHAGRIPLTLAYARAQNNNHLLVEAAGLYTAGLALPDHPSARRWRRLGWRWFNRGLQAQIDPDGAYTQHSSNYQRLMLQAALWVKRLAEGQGESLSQEALERLRAATRWLAALLEAGDGRVPNLGANDGAYIFPLTICPYHDYRPVLQAAAGSFLGASLLPEGPWDEMGLWLGEKSETRKNASRLSLIPAGDEPAVIRNPSHETWAYLRAARFTGRPGHADQLHLDLWWRGLNVAQDAGSYLYNAPPPWDNALARSQVHNTLVVNGLEQMTRAGRFLYLERAQAQVISQERGEGGAWRISAQHDGYRRLGVIHRRTVTVDEAGPWIVEDDLLADKPGLAGRRSPFVVHLNWLLPDWEYEILAQGGAYEVWLASPYGKVRLRLSSDDGEGRDPLRLQAVRSGELVFGEGRFSPTWGWRSLTYGEKDPALALRLQAGGALPLSLRTVWIFPDQG